MRRPRIASVCLLSVAALVGCSSSSGSTAGPATPTSGNGPTAAAATAAAPPSTAVTAPPVTPAVATIAVPTAAATTVAGTASAGSAAVKGTVTLKGTGTGVLGAISASGDYTETVQPVQSGGNACGDFAQQGDHGSGNEFALVLPSVNIGGHKILLTVSPYATVHGPGDYHYQGDDNGLISTFGLVSVDVDDTQEDFADPGTGTADLTIGSDGSGKVTFAGYVDENGSDDTLGGSVTWTCG